VQKADSGGTGQHIPARVLARLVPSPLAACTPPRELILHQIAGLSRNGGWLGKPSEQDVRVSPPDTHHEGFDLPAVNRCYSALDLPM